MQSLIIILYVRDQEISRDFYREVLGKEPVLDVPGMTEFSLSENLKLGLMPEENIGRILGNFLPHPAKGNGIPRCELYIETKEPEKMFARAISKGAMLLDEVKPRNWGDRAGYVADTDGHVLAFAERI